MQRMTFTGFSTRMSFIFNLWFSFSCYWPTKIFYNEILRIWFPISVRQPHKKQANQSFSVIYATKCKSPHQYQIMYSNKSPSISSLFPFKNRLPKLRRAVPNPHSSLFFAAVAFPLINSKPSVCELSYQPKHTHTGTHAHTHIRDMHVRNSLVAITVHSLISRMRNVLRINHPPWVRVVNAQKTSS